MAKPVTPKAAQKEAPVIPELTAAQVTQRNNSKVASLEAQRTSLANKYKQEKKVTVVGSPFYRPYFGNNMPIAINGITVHIPLDGRQYEIPETFAAVFHERIYRVDAQRLVQQRLGDIASNLESYAGEKDFIRAI